MTRPESGSTAVPLDEQPVTIRVERNVFTGGWQYTLVFVSGGKVVAPARAKRRHKAAREAVVHLWEIERG
jgi:hypothetical protein